MRYLFVLAFFTGWSGLSAQDIPLIKSDQIGAWKQATDDTVYVLNFWATWCGPCVAELPEFEKINDEFSGQKVRVVLISTDFKRELTKVQAFVQRKKLNGRVLFMDEPSPNKWIDLVNTDWSGALPATLIVCKNKKAERFFEQSMTYEVLKNEIQAILARQ
jgi:thiol-disulfide isomerase/thioredoxin